MRRYTDKQIVDYEKGRQDWINRAEELRYTVLCYSFNDPRAQKFSREGFFRRLITLDHAMRRLAEIYPPNTRNASRDTVRDVEILLQSFVMNVFGAIDNLAWIWAFERGVRHPCGKELRRTQVVFDGGGAGRLYDSLTPALKQMIIEAKDWLNALRDYRNGVAHQIPIYIPRLLNEDEVKKAACLNVAINDAIVARNYGLVNELFVKHNNLGDYGAVMALSAEHREHIFHAQMVCDLATVVELGETLFSELNRLSCENYKLPSSSPRA
jgi:hypothetical protein